MGNDELRYFLSKIASPRNHLAHSNSISVRQAEQILCYTHDVIDAVKNHLEEINMGKEYNAPTVIKITDSLGTIYHAQQIRRNSTGRGLVEVKEDELTWLRVGDTLSIEVEIDPSFASDDYDIGWGYSTSVFTPNPPLTGKRFTKELKKRM